MAVDKSKSGTEDDEPATLPGPAPYEEELKDYGHEDDLIPDMPDSHPEPKPTRG